MPVVVQKYGGSSVASPEKLKEVAQRVIATRDQGHSVVVVVSAMADTTDELLSLASKVSHSPERRELDMLLTAGERISMALLSMAIRELGGNSISFTGSQAGILTNDRHIDARIIEVRPVRVQDELERGNIVIVAGYQGMSYKREITTLGRGGSDTTAVALAAALDAEWCEICSDVDGVYTSDPRVVPGAKRIPEMDYEETREMAENGAKVLNPQAVEFARENHIAIYARATTGPLPGKDPTADGTVVRKSAPKAPGTVTGIACQKSIHRLRGTIADIEPLFALLRSFELSPLRSSVERLPDGFGLLLTLDPQNLHQAEEFEKSLLTQFGDTLKLNTENGAVSAIGSGINAGIDNVIRGSAALREIPVTEITTSPHRITWVVASEDADEATRRLHAEFLD